MHIDSLTTAIRVFVEFFLGGDEERERTDINPFEGGKGPMAYRVKRDGQVYYVMYKREWFYSFGRIYGNPGGYSGIGQTFNMRMLNAAAKENALLVVFIPSSATSTRLYACQSSEALAFVEEYNTKRIPASSLIDNDYEGSIPASMLWRLDGGLA
jgi:hypothetical protein